MSPMRTATTQPAQSPGRRYSSLCHAELARIGRAGSELGSFGNRGGLIVKREFGIMPSRMVK